MTYNINMNKNIRLLDWHSNHDPRSKNFAVSEIIEDTEKNETVLWKEGIVLDQGREGACVGFGWMAEVLAEPVSPVNQPEEIIANELAKSYYKRAQKIDPWPGEDYEGTSVLAGAKIMQEEGYIGEYRWCFGIEDLKKSILNLGPVVIGVPWYESMYETDVNGIVKIDGNKVGGHCILVTGYIPNMKIDGYEQEAFRWRNSWGNEYGIDGSGYIRYTDLHKLLKDGGEACIPVERKAPDNYIFKNL